MYISCFGAIVVPNTLVVVEVIPHNVGLWKEYATSNHCQILINIFSYQVWKVWNKTFFNWSHGCCSHCENEDILYDYQKDFTIWQPCFLHLWSFALLCHKLCELVETLTINGLTKFCKKVHLNLKIIINSLSLSHWIKPKCSFLPLFTNAIVVSHTFTGLPRPIWRLDICNE